MHAHARAMADWKEKTGPFQQAAQVENTANINERTLAGNVFTAKTQADRLAEQGRIADEKNRISEIRARAYSWKQQHPDDGNWDTTGPTYVLKNPQTGEVKNTGIKTGQLAEEDLQLLKNKGNVDAARERGAGAYAGTQSA